MPPCGHAAEAGHEACAESWGLAVGATGSGFKSVSGEASAATGWSCSVPAGAGATKSL